jgi:hypothetical protein
MMQVDLSEKGNTPKPSCPKCKHCSLCITSVTTPPVSEQSTQLLSVEAFALTGIVPRIGTAQSRYQTPMSRAPPAPGIDMINRATRPILVRPGKIGDAP